MTLSYLDFGLLKCPGENKYMYFENEYPIIVNA